MIRKDLLYYIGLKNALQCNFLQETFITENLSSFFENYIEHVGKVYQILVIVKDWRLF